jgi:peroxiredoxin
MGKFLSAFCLCLSALWASGELSNRRAPGFALPDSNIAYHDLADYRGKVVLIEIMQTGCPHCVTFAKVLEDIARKYAGRVQVLAIANPPDTTATVARFIREQGISYPILFDCGQVAGSYVKATPQKPSIEIPHVFIVDQAGIIRNDFGYSVMTAQIFEGRGLYAELDKLLGPGAAGKAVRPASKK